MWGGSGVAEGHGVAAGCGVAAGRRVAVGWQQGGSGTQGGSKVWGGSRACVPAWPSGAAAAPFGRAAKGSISLEALSTTTSLGTGLPPAR